MNSEKATMNAKKATMNAQKTTMNTEKATMNKEKIIVIFPYPHDHSRKDGLTLKTNHSFDKINISKINILSRIIVIVSFFL